MRLPRSSGAPASVTSHVPSVARPSASGSHLRSRLSWTGSGSSAIQDWDVAIATHAMTTTLRRRKIPGAFAATHALGRSTGPPPRPLSEDPAPHQSSAALPATAGTSNAYAKTYQLGTTGWNDGSHASGSM